MTDDEYRAMMEKSKRLKRESALARGVTREPDTKEGALLEGLRNLFAGVKFEPLTEEECKELIEYGWQNFRGSASTRTRT